MNAKFAIPFAGHRPRKVSLVRSKYGDLAFTLRPGGQASFSIETDGRSFPIMSALAIPGHLRRLVMMLIRDVIRNREPYSMKPSASVQDAAEFMASRNVGAVCVVDDGGKLLGVFSERDVVKRVVLQKRDPASLRVGDVTSELRAVIRCDETPHQALERMELIGTRHLPVVDGDRWVGMLSMRDLMRVELSEQGDEIKLLHEYIQH